MTSTTEIEARANAAKPDEFYEARQHIGWLKMYVSDMRPENWRDMKDHCDGQLSQLSAELTRLRTALAERDAEIEALRNENGSATTAVAIEINGEKVFVSPRVAAAIASARKDALKDAANVAETASAEEESALSGMRTPKEMDMDRQLLRGSCVALGIAAAIRALGREG